MFFKPKEKISTGVFPGLTAVHLTYIHKNSVTQDTCDFEQVSKATARSRHVITGLGGQDILYKNVMLPEDIERKNIKETIKWQFYDIEVEDYEIVYRKTNSSPDGSIKILCAAVPKKLIDNFVEKNSGIFTGLDIQPFAAWRGYRASYPDSEPVIIVVNGTETVTVAAGKEKLEFVREIPTSLNIDLEKMRTIDHFKQAFNAKDARVVELQGEEPLWTVSMGYALAYQDPDFKNILPEKHRRIRPMEFKKPRKNEIALAVSVLLLIGSAIPHAMAYNIEKETAQVKETIRQMDASVNEINNLQSRISMYQEYIGAVSSHEKRKIIPIIDDIKNLTPQDVVIDKLEMTQNYPADTVKKENKEKPDNKTTASSQDNAPPDSENKSSVDSKVSYQVNYIKISARSLSIKSMGLLLDNIDRLRYTGNTEIKNIVQELPGYYAFDIVAEIVNYQ